MLNFFVKAFELKIKFHTDSGLSEPNFERPDLDGKSAVRIAWLQPKNTTQRHNLLGLNPEPSIQSSAH